MLARAGTWSTITALSLVALTDAWQHRHLAVDIPHRRQIPTPVAVAPDVSTPALPPVTTYTEIVPSPGAAPIPITQISQLVDSYVPQFTLCELPPLAFFPVTATPTLVTSLSAPWRNYSISTPSGTGSCTTIFSPTQTMVCRTTLTDLVRKYTITNCDQDITFSTQYGYVLVLPTSTPASVPAINPPVKKRGAHRHRAAQVAPDLPSVSPAVPVAPTLIAPVPPGLPTTLVTPTLALSSSLSLITPAPSIHTLTTYYLAPWQYLTDGTAPGEVFLKVCTTFDNGTLECIEQFQIWSTTLKTMTATSTVPVNISTVIYSGSQIIVETFVANVTESFTTFEISTTMSLEYITSIESTRMINVTTTTGPTVTITRTVEEATSTLHTTLTSTSHLTRTTTVYPPTITVTPVPLPSPISVSLPTTEDTDLPTPTQSVDFASMFGFNG